MEAPVQDSKLSMSPSVACPPPYKAAGVTELKMCFLFGDIGSKIPVMVANWVQEL